MEIRGSAATVISRAQFRKPAQEMTYIESPVETIAKFIPSWRNTPSERLEKELVSSFNETHHKPDEFRYKYRNGKLFGFEAETGLETEIKIDRSTYFGKKDGEFFDTLTTWVAENDSGTALWISPSSEDAYLGNKVTMYVIEKVSETEKTIFNISVVFETPKTHTLEIAAKLNSKFIGVKDPEILRNKLFGMDEDFDLEALLDLIAVAQNFPATPSQELIKYFVNEIRSGRDAASIAQEMRSKGVVGDFALSCGRSNSVNSLGNSLVLNFGGAEDQFGSLDFECPHCHGINTRPFGKLITNCQRCGGNVSC